MSARRASVRVRYWPARRPPVAHWPTSTRPPHVSTHSHTSFTQKRTQQVGLATDLAVQDRDIKSNQTYLLPLSRPSLNIFKNNAVKVHSISYPHSNFDRCKHRHIKFITKPTMSVVYIYDLKLCSTMN